MAKTGLTKISSRPKLYLTIEGGKDLGYIFERFEWQAMTNGGYIVRGKVRDSYWNVLREFATQDKYLDRGRRIPTKVVWELEWPGADRTGKHLGYLVDVRANGINTGGGFEFVAVDPPSYWLNAGDSSGEVYEGSVKEVIEQVIQRYFIEPNRSVVEEGGRVEVSETLDNVKNKWYMMRMDPKTFIGSLLDWASSVTGNKTNFIVSSDGNLENEVPVIWVKEQAARNPIDYGSWVFDTNAPGGHDGMNFEFLANTFISVFQRQLITGGISATTEKYIDRITDAGRTFAHVYDENTSSKKNVNIDERKGFKKPQGPPGSFEKPHEWSTSVLAIPEHNAGDLGLRYQDYIDGRARGMFLNMLNLVMRLKVRVTGETSRDLANAHNLGVSKMKLLWIDADFQPFFLGGDWLVYGFHHIMTRGEWFTDLYLARLDYDASAVKV